MRRLNSSNLQHVKEWITSIDNFLVDCDGVLWRGNEAIPGVAQTIDGKYPRLVSIVRIRIFRFYTVWIYIASPIARSALHSYCSYA